MNQKDFINRGRKRELRVQYRTKRLEYEQEKRTNWNNWKDRKAIGEKAAVEAIKADNKKSKKPDKKLGPEKFLSLYSYITYTAYENRHNIPSSWKPHSFNEQKQNTEFLKSFVCPFPLPEILLWATHAPEYTPARTKTPDYIFIRLAKKWIQDIVNGGSFYKQNKEFFTKAEAHYFLCSKIPYDNGSSVIKLYFYAKCRARSCNHKLSLMIAEVFTVKFREHFKSKLIEGFLDLLTRTLDYRYERAMLGDISDFVLKKLLENKKHTGKRDCFSFSGRTISSIINLANEWHEETRQEAEAQRIQRDDNRRQRRNNEKTIDTSHWKGLGIYQFRHESDGYIWTVTELKTAQDLLNEGRKMKNCVASYTYGCASGNSAIFTVERIYPVNQIIEKVATLEVQLSTRTLIQAKGKCNTAVTPKVLNIINRWANANRIKVGLAV